VPESSVEEEPMFRVLGGALLLGQDLPLDADPDSTAGCGFVERASRAMDVPEPPDEDCDLVRQAFALVPDRPMSHASLGGFCLGALYAGSYLSGSDADSAGTGTVRARADGVTDSQGEPHRLGFAVHGPDTVEVPGVMKHGEALHDRDRGDHDVR